jgi:tyrosyl-tRNA synthetase
MDKKEQLLNRGIEKIIDLDNLKKELDSGKKLRVKLGIDPTGDKIHIGRATQLWKLRLFQDLGHKVVLIIGDFTALVGDPSDKPDGRTGLTQEEIKNNMKAYLKQVGKILDLKKIEVRYNSEWFSKMELTDFLSLASNFSVQQLVQRRNFKERWESQKPITLKEITYPLLQGYDSVAVKSDIELGGNDQLFNLNSGRDVQKLFGQRPQDIMTLKMLDGLDGRKMSTSWGNVVNITDEPNDMFGKLMSMKDDMIDSYFELCTQLSDEEINKLKKEFTNPRDLKAVLSKEIISLYHDKEEAEKAEQEFEKVFKDKDTPTDIREFFCPKDSYSILEILPHLDLAKSKGEAKRLVQQGGVKIENVVINDIHFEVTVKEGLILQVGKRNFAKLTKKS